MHYLEYILKNIQQRLAELDSEKKELLELKKNLEDKLRKIRGKGGESIEISGGLP